MVRLPGLWLSSPPLPIEKPPPFGLPGTLWLPVPAPNATGGCVLPNGVDPPPPNANGAGDPPEGVPNANGLGGGAAAAADWPNENEGVAGAGAPKGAGEEPNAGAVEVAPKRDGAVETGAPNAGADIVCDMAAEAPKPPKD